MQEKKRHLSAFTLIELLVVISIIGILTVLVAANLNSARSRARDTARKSDLAQYRNALEIYANANGGLYPIFTTTTDATTESFCTLLGFPGTSCPKDPQAADTGNTYNYRSDGAGAAGTPGATQYFLWATLEYGGSTTYYWVVCSNGKSGQTSTAIPPSGGSCPI